MKKITALLGLLFTIWSCSHPSADETPAFVDYQYMPLDANLSWVYKVNSTDPQTPVYRDSLCVNGTLTFPESNKVYTRITGRPTPMGFYSNCLYNNGLRKENTDVFLSGTIQFNAFNTAVPLQFSVRDFKMFSQTALENTLLSETSGQLLQALPNSPYTLQIDYNLKAYDAGAAAVTLPNSSVNYTNVRKVKMQLFLHVEATTPNGFSAILIHETDPVVTSFQHYAPGKGVVWTSSRITYQIDQTALSSMNVTPGQLSFPTQMDVTQTEELIKPLP